MTILQPKEVMQNVEKSHNDTALTMKEVKALLSLSKDTIMYNLYKCVRYHY